MPPLLPVAVALYLASRGWHVFPCRPRAKEPLTPRGYLDASRDPAQLRRWWTDEPEANLAVATGAISALVVVDVDGPRGRASWAALEREHGAAPTLRQITGRPDGGSQLLYAYPGHVEVGCRTGFLPGLDVRGDGGYVLLPPSIHPSGQRYWWLDRGVPRAMPRWLLEAITPPAPVKTMVKPGRPVRPVSLDAAERYLDAALERACEAVRGLGRGGRATGLYHHASCIGELVAGGALDYEFAQGLLVEAALATGLPEREAIRQVKCGLESGRRKPRGGPR